VPGKADFGGIDHAMEFTAGFIILLEDPHQSSQYVAFLDRTLIGGDDDIRAIKDPFNQNRFVPFRGRLSGDIISAPIIGPDDSQRLTVAGT
jgi:hypothetical protein